jgi:hypothetical protein
MKQKAVEEQMMENRVRKLLKEQDNLNKQIEKANKHATLAEQAMERYEYEQRFKAAMKQANEERIE